MHGMHCLPLQFLNILVHSVFSASLWAVFTPQLMDEDHVLYLQPPTFLSDLDKKKWRHIGVALFEWEEYSILICFSSKLELHLKCWFWFLFIHWIKTKSHQWEDENIFFFFLMQPFLRYKAFMWTVYFLKPNLIFFVLFLVSLIHSLFCGPVN